MKKAKIIKLWIAAYLLFLFLIFIYPVSIWWEWKLEQDAVTIIRSNGIETYDGGGRECPPFLKPFAYYEHENEVDFGGWLFVPEEEQPMLKLFNERYLERIKYISDSELPDEFQVVPEIADDTAFIASSAFAPPGNETIPAAAKAKVHLFIVM